MDNLVHYSVDKTTRLCTGRKKGKDELTEDWSSVTCKGCLLKRLSMQLNLNAERNEFRTFHDNVYDYAQGKGILADDNVDASIIGEFMSNLVQYKMVLKNHDIDITEIPEEYEDTFLDWFLFEREIKKEKTVAELYIESKKFKDDYGFEIVEYIKSCVPYLREPIWSIFTVIQKLDDYLFNVKELFTDTLFQIYADFTPGKVSVGVSFFGRLGQFGDHSYLGSHVKLLSEVDVRIALGFNEAM